MNRLQVSFLLNFTPRFVSTSHGALLNLVYKLSSYVTRQYYNILKKETVVPKKNPWNQNKINKMSAHSHCTIFNPRPFELSDLNRLYFWQML